MTKKYKFCLGAMFEVKAENSDEALIKAQKYKPKTLELIPI